MIVVVVVRIGYGTVLGAIQRNRRIDDEWSASLKDVRDRSAAQVLGAIQMNLVQEEGCRPVASFIWLSCPVTIVSSGHVAVESY